MINKQLVKNKIKTEKKKSENREGQRERSYHRS